MLCEQSYGFFPQCDDGFFVNDCGFLCCLRLRLEFRVNSYSLEAIINLKSDKSRDQIGERDRK